MTDKWHEQHIQIINSTLNTGTGGIDPEFGVSFEPYDVMAEIDSALVLSISESATEENSPYVFWANRLRDNKNLEEFTEACRLMVLDERLWTLFEELIYDYLFDAQRELSKKEANGAH